MKSDYYRENKNHESNLEDINTTPYDKPDVPDRNTFTLFELIQNIGTWLVNFILL